jgi:hypothetical protein
MANPDGDTSVDTLRRTLRARLDRRAAVDLRALAAFRIGLALLLLANLGSRARHFEALYTDRGILPAEALVTVYGDAYALHSAIGEPLLGILLFPVAALVTLSLLVGYRTRLSTVLSAALLILLHTRNPIVLNGGDLLLSSLLLWAVFLPLGRRWSLDARRYSREGTAVSSVASAAVLLQVFLVYGVNATHKVDSDAWMSGDAVAAVFQAEQFTIYLGEVLPAFPEVLTAFTYAWMALLLASPLLVLLAGIPRAILATLFAGMHVGMFLSMPIGLFPLVSLTGLLLFYQSTVWDGAARLTAGTRVASTVRRWAHAVEARVPPPRPLSERVGVARREAIAGPARFTLLTLVPALLLGVILLSAIGTAEIADPPERFEETVDTVNLDQSWQMFAPVPVQTTKWMAAPANVTDGRTVDAFHGGPPDLGRPDNVAASFPSFRWRKAFAAVRDEDAVVLRSHFADYLCDRYDREHEASLERVRLYYGYERVDPETGEVAASGGRTLVEYDCDGPTVQGR